MALPKRDELNQSREQDYREMRFVTAVIERTSKDKGLAASLRRADNPGTEYQSWEFLASMGVDLEREHQRLAFAMIAAAIAKAKVDCNGQIRLGAAIAKCYEDGADSTQAKARLRRLLACDDCLEVCRVLRPVFSLISSKVKQPIDYARILKQLIRFHFSSGEVKAQWAQEFYQNFPKD